jgi:putative inorganic carbon (HCO3(-)) transporter
MIRDHPLAGVGLNAFHHVVHEQYPFTYYKSDFVPHAHNLELQVALDFGLPGLACFLAAVATAIVGALHAFRTSLWTRHLALGVFGGLAAYLAFGLVDAVPVGSKPTFLLWAVLALGIALGEMSRLVPDTTDAVRDERD